MIPSQSFVVQLVAAAGIALAADPDSALHVLRYAPSSDAGPTASVAVTFDRPVAGSLDRSVDPKAIFRIVPAVAGTLDWRDPVTLRFRPAAPLPPNSSYTVTVGDRFQAMDGSRLEQPFTFTFRVRGPKVLAGWPVGPNGGDRFVTPDSRLDLVVDAAADPAVVARTAYLEFENVCPTPGAIRLKVGSQRPVNDKDRWDFREAGGWDRDRSADRLRRVVTLVPQANLPKGCTGHLVLPSAFDEPGKADLLRWEFSTYGSFRLERSTCGWDRQFCPNGPVVLRFSTPVRGAEVQRNIGLRPAAAFVIGDTADSRAEWVLEAPLQPHTGYAIVADPSLTDVFGQKLTGNPVLTIGTTGFAPAINYPSGRSVVERKGARTFGVTFVNVDTLEVRIARVPDTLEAAFLARSEWSWRELWPALAPRAERRRIAVPGDRDRVRVYGVILPALVAGPRKPTLMAVQVASSRLDSLTRNDPPVALVQVTDLGVHARVGAEDGVVWVTGASDGAPRPGATVTLYDDRGRIRAEAITDSVGVARLSHYRSYPPDAEDAEDRGWSSFQGYVAAVLDNDRAVLGINDYDPDLSPWRFNVTQAWGSARFPSAVALFTERGIYRPGEPLYVKAIVRTGPLGALTRPGPGDSLRWIFHDRSDESGAAGTLRDTVVALSAFGTADQRFTIPSEAALGDYRIGAQLRRGGRWIELASAYYRVAEYRPPEFLVDVTADSGVRFAGDSIRASVEARYLFGAPMARAAVRWALRTQSVGSWDLDIPGTEGFHITEEGWWYEEVAEQQPGVRVQSNGLDTLDATGRLALRLKLAESERGRPSRATVEATVTDINRQTVSATASAIVHPAAFYIGAKPEGQGYFWTAGSPVTVGVIAMRPDGSRVPGVRIQGTVVRREWHQVRREREGYGELVGEWVSDTVARCAVATTADAAPCRFTPPAGGTYTVHFTARDGGGREVSTSFYRWAVGKDWVPWNDESQFRMDVVPDRTRYSAGDTATVLFASPFTDAEAWITVEREGLLEQRRMRITSGTTTLKLPVTEAFAPNVFVSIVVARGRSAPPGPLDDPGRPTIRVGYAELRVTPERKRLTVSLTPRVKEYRPGDTATVALEVRDAAGKGRKSEVTLWAVDEGVLALTGYRTPDPLDLLYRPRGLGMRLASTLTTVAPQVPEGEKGKRAPGGGGGAEGGDILRSRFQTTAFFLGSVVTDANGRATASAKLPDNLTTFRLMAVAVTETDRFGKGESSLLVTRPLVARPALPRFLRESDKFAAGVVVNARTGDTRTAAVSARAKGADLRGPNKQQTTLEPGRGREVRFDFVTGQADSASFRFDATSAGDSDAVAIRLPIRPNHHPLSFTVAGVLHDTATAEVLLPEGIDPARSRVTVSLGSSPLAMIRGAAQWLRVYPYWCTEQISSAAEPLIALYRSAPVLGADSATVRRARRDLEGIVATLSRRQRADGGIGLWSATAWTTPWLSSYAGAVLLEAKAAGIAVNDSVIARLGEYLKRSLAESGPVIAPVADWYRRSDVRLSDRVMAVDYLSRAGLRDRPSENELIRAAAQLAWEDRVRLAHVLSRGGDASAAKRLLEPAWAAVKIEGRRATLPESTPREFYFESRMRPAAWLLSATLAVDPSHPLIGPLVETLIQQGRGERWIWNTQDYGTAISALAEFQERQSANAAKGVRISAGGRQLLQLASLGAARDSSFGLAGLVEAAPSAQRLRLALRADAGPLFYYVTVTTAPRVAPVRPGDKGIRVERWYESYDTGKPVTEIVEGALVRVRLKVTVPSDRQFVVLDDPLPAGLEAIDLSLRTVGGIAGPGAVDSAGTEDDAQQEGEERWVYGSWDAGWWSPFDHRELRDDRVVFVATRLWKGGYSATYLARATTPGTFTRAPAHAEEMYNPAVFGESDGGVFTVLQKTARRK